MDNFLILWYNSRKAAIVHGPYRCTTRRFRTCGTMAKKQGEI